MSTDLESVVREHSSRLISVLTRIFGPHNLELAEDVMQEAYVAAIDGWSRDGLPDDPASWILRVARNRAVDSIRRERTRVAFAEDLTTFLDSEFTLQTFVEQEFEESKIRDDELRMIFMCCNAPSTPDNSIPLILKTLCGLDVRQIARALVLPEATIRKRLTRTRESLRGAAFDFPSESEMPAALRTVRHVLYLLFNEGNLSSADDTALRPELCRDAMRLTKLIVDVPTVADAPTVALLALMCFHAARLPARVGADGALLGLDQQDRGLWDAALVNRGMALLERSSRMGQRQASRFHLEAAIASRHCTAKTFEATDWVSICRLYDRWADLEDQPFVVLNRAIAISYRDGPEAALPIVEALRSDKRMARHSALPSTLATLYRRLGRVADAERMLEEARACATAHERDLLERQLSRWASP